jgi:hypothetical protein
MLGSLEMTRVALVSAITRRDSCDVALNVVVIRLLAIAVMITNGRTCRASLPGVAVPKGYRAWPYLDCGEDVHGLRQRLRFYVCPKAATTADDEAFPVGTALVVETVRLSDGDEAEPTSVFVMGKVSSLYARNGRCSSRDGWVYATYDPMGCAADGVSVASGIGCVTVGKA